MSRKINTRTRYKLVGSDFSAQEPRLTAFMANDPAMKQAYLEGKDLYCVIAASMFNNNYEDNLEFYPAGTELEIDGQKIICGKKTHLNKAGKERRSAAKTLLLALLYGMSAATAGARMGKTAKEGQELMDNFFKSFPKVKELMDNSKASLKETGYVEDWAGRRRRLPDINLPSYEVSKIPTAGDDNSTFNPIWGCEDRALPKDAKIIHWEKRIKDEIDRANSFSLSKNEEPKNEISNKKYEDLAREAQKEGIIITANTGRKAQADRQCLNARIQGGAASLTKLAMVNIANDQELKDLNAELVITVHDEVLVECPAFYAERVEKRLPQVMIDTAKPYIDVPMACDPANESRWYISEYAVALHSELEKLEKGDAKAGIPPIPHEQALEKLYKAHIENSPEVIRAMAITGEPIDF